MDLPGLCCTREEIMGDMQNLRVYLHINAKNADSSTHFRIIRNPGTIAR
jgi:hypothetical protein